MQGYHIMQRSERGLYSEVDEGNFKQIQSKYSLSRKFFYQHSSHFSHFLSRLESF